MSEEWRDIPGYEGRYQVSDHGRVRSVDRHVRCGKQGKGLRLVKGRVLRPGNSHDAAVTVALGKGNSISVHKVVLETFVGECPKGLERLHNDGNHLNNTLGNLRYGTRSENNFDVTDHDRRTLSRAQVRYLRDRKLNGLYHGELADIARDWGVIYQTIWRAANGMSYLRV